MVGVISLARGSRIGGFQIKVYPRTPKGGEDQLPNELEEHK